MKEYSVEEVEAMLAARQKQRAEEDRENMKVRAERAESYASGAAHHLDKAVFHDTQARSGPYARDWHRQKADKALEWAHKLEQTAARHRSAVATYKARHGNPSGGGLSLYSLALGAALGAAALYFTMKPKQ